MPGTPLQGQSGVGTSFPTTLGTIGGLQVPVSAIVVGTDGAPYMPSASGGILLPMPAAMAVYDPSLVHVFVGDASNNSIRTSMVGAIVAQLQDLLADGTPYDANDTRGFPAMFRTGLPQVQAQGTIGAARMSDEQVLQTTGPPRENFVQGTQTLQGTAELTILPAGGTGVYNDLTFIHISSTSETVKTVVNFRDSFGGTVKFPVGIGKSGGSNMTIPYWNQAIPNSQWSVQLETSVGAERVFVNVKAEPRTAS